MTPAPERLTQFEQWRIDREIEAIARRLVAKPEPRPLIISRENLEISAAEQRCIAHLEHSNAMAASKGNL